MIKRFLALAPHRKQLLAEAFFSLLIASAAIRLLPFRRVFRMAARPLGTKKLADVREVVWAVESVAARFPWKMVCFQKGLALQTLLRGRGIDAKLNYGVGFDPERSIRAHVWVSADGDIVIGGEEAPNFRLLASLPPDPAASL